MNRQEQFKKLLEEWLELDLPMTCTSLDTYTSIRINRKESVVTFTERRLGKELEIARANLLDGEVVGMVYVTTTPHLGLVLFGLERAIEEN